MTPETLASELSRDWAHGEHVEAQSARFDQPVALDGRTLCSFDLSGAQFAAGLSARGTQFRGMAWFHGARIDGGCDLSGAVFRSDLRLDGLVCDVLDLTGARFEGVLSLDGARLGRLILRDVLCLANLSLAGTQVAGAVDLSGSDLMGGVWARAARFGQLLAGDTWIEGRQAGVHA